MTVSLENCNLFENNSKMSKAVHERYLQNLQFVTGGRFFIDFLLFFSPLSEEFLSGRVGRSRGDILHIFFFFSIASHKNWWQWWWEGSGSSSWRNRIFNIRIAHNIIIRILIIIEGVTFCTFSSQSVCAKTDNNDDEKDQDYHHEEIGSPRKSS